VKGDVKVVGEKVIVENFSYNNGAPDAFFYIGTSGCPSGSGTLLQYPAGAADRPLGDGLSKAPLTSLQIPYTF